VPSRWSASGEKPAVEAQGLNALACPTGFMVEFLTKKKFTPGVANRTLGGKIAMSNIIPFMRSRPRLVHGSCLVQKLVNGELVACVNVDALSPMERAQFFLQQDAGAPQQGCHAPMPIRPQP